MPPVLLKRKGGYWLYSYPPQWKKDLFKIYREMTEKQLYDLAKKTEEKLKSFEDHSELLNEMLGFSELNEYFCHPEDDDHEA